MKKPPYRVYKKKKEEKPPVHIPEKIDTPEAEQLVDDLYKIGNYLLIHWKKIAAVLGVIFFIGGSYLGYAWYQDSIELKASQIVDEGLFKLEKGKEKEAVKLFNEAEKNYPEAPSTLIGRFLKGKIEKENSEFTFLIEKNRYLTSPPSKSSLIASHIENGKLAEAENIISRIKRDEDWTYPEALYDGIIIALKKGNREKALELLEILKGDYKNLPITTLAERLVE